MPSETKRESLREEVDRHLAASDGRPEGIHAALRALADALDRLRRPTDEAARLQRLAEQGLDESRKDE